MIRILSGYLYGKLKQFCNVRVEVGQRNWAASCLEKEGKSPVGMTCRCG